MAVAVADDLVSADGVVVRSMVVEMRGERRARREVVCSCLVARRAVWGRGEGRRARRRRRDSMVLVVPGLGWVRCVVRVVMERFRTPDAWVDWVGKSVERRGFGGACKMCW